MGKRGPKKEPVQITKAKGNPGKRKVNDAPVGLLLSGNPPSWFPPEAKREWKRLLHLLGSKGMLLESYRGNFEMLCLDYGMWYQCAKVVAEMGLTYTTVITTKSGSEYEKEEMRPEVIRAEKYQASYYRRGASFGLTPSDDGALGFPGGAFGNEDPMEAALGG